MIDTSVPRQQQVSTTDQAAKKRIRKAQEKLDAEMRRFDLTHQSYNQSIGFQLDFSMSVDILQEPVKKPAMCAEDNPFREAFIPVEPMKATMRLVNKMRELMKECNSKFEPQEFKKCMSCWHSLTYPKDTQENLDHYRFCVIMGYEKLTYKETEVQKRCDECRHKLPLGKKRQAVEQPRPALQ